MTSTRERILLAAREVANENQSILGVTLSLESVARAAGLTKPGLMYHFPTKEALMHGLVTDAAERWVALMLTATDGVPAADLDAFDRHRAYIRATCSSTITRVDYWLFADVLYQPTLAEPWYDQMTPWFAVDELSPAAASMLTAARFCADGAWTARATDVFPAGDLTATLEHAFALVENARSMSGDPTTDDPRTDDPTTDDPKTKTSEKPRR